QTVLTWARNSSSAAAFLGRIGQQGLSHKNHREFTALIRSRLTAASGQPVSDDNLWGFLRSMVILHFDLLTGGSRDATHAVNCLRHVLQPDAGPGAAELFSRLRVISAEVNRSAGEYTREILTQRLQGDGFRLVPSSDCREDLARLDALKEHILDDIRTDIGGLTLNRVEAVEAPAGQYGDAAMLLFTGPPGVGKSGIWKMLVDRHRLAGPSLILSADRVDGKGWLGFARSQGISRTAEELLLAMSTHSYPCIFIDGIDRIEDDGSRLAVNDLLRTAEKVLPPVEGCRRWWCIATAREGSLGQLTWLDRKVVQQIFPVRIPELADEEVRLVLDEQPRLRALSSQARLKPILRNPFLLDLLTDRRIAGDEAEKVPATEVEVSDVWWERVVGRDGQSEGRERQQALVEAARRLINAPRRRFPDGGMPPDALVTLEADRVIIRDQGQNVYRFSHDLLEDWSLLRLLEQRRQDLPAYLRELGQPHGLLRAVRLLGCMLLERGEAADEWAELLRAFEQAAELAPRWRQAVLTAPFLSTRLEELLDKAREALLAEDGRLLIDLLVALRTTEVDVDPRIAETTAAIADSPAEALALALRFPLPRWYAWYWTLHWLLRHSTELSEAARHEAARIMEIWQERSGPDDPLRREVGELAFAWLEQSDED
ncbi:MAG TPA: AAA family ATPase, partial [Gemmataceae bacterium]|nr:AAA family ATPase [Gemmataceae bacterium]